MKKKLPPRPFMYPKPAILVGSLVNGKPNFMTIANCGIAAYDPPVISVSSFKAHYTNIGIKKEKTFSVNIPSVSMASVTDYCGLYSGRKVDKSQLFEVFYGQLKTAPMITISPVAMECKLVRTVNFPEEFLFLGEIISIYVDDKCLTDGKPDIKKVDPLIYSTSDKSYYRLGEFIGKAYNIGQKLEGEK